MIDARDGLYADGLRDVALFLELVATWVVDVDVAGQAITLAARCRGIATYLDERSS